MEWFMEWLGAPLADLKVWWLIVVGLVMVVLGLLVVGSQKRPKKI